MIRKALAKVRGGGISILHQRDAGSSAIVAAGVPHAARRSPLAERYRVGDRNE